MLTRNTASTDSVDDTLPDPSGNGHRSPTIFARLGRQLAQAILMIAVLAVGFAVMQWLIATKPQVPSRPAFPTVYTVDTIVAEAGDYRPSFIAYGEVTAGRTVELRSLVAGQVVSISDRLQPGDQVEAGAPLVTIDRFNFEGALREAEANLAETRARIAESQARIAIERKKLERGRDQLALAERDLTRIRDLAERGTATQKQLEDREFILSQRAATVEQTEINITAENARLAQQRAVLERLQWKADQARRNLDDTVLTAPFAGIVRSATVEAGKMVSANDVVVSIYEQGNLDVRFTLSDARYGRIQTDNDGLIGREVEVIWQVGPSENRLSAKIERLGADIAASRGGVEIFAALETTGALVTPRPGAFVEIVVPDRLFAGHFRIPETAVYDTDTIYTVVNGRLQARQVTISAYDGEYALVTGEVADGEAILTTRIAEIGEGLRVAGEGDRPAPSGAPGSDRQSAPQAAAQQ